MHTRIYRFEIVRALANAMYEATDTSNQAPVLMYEWTPDVEDRDAAKLRLAEIQDSVAGEVLSVDASLYLIVSSREQGSEALQLLREKNLFTGEWPGLAPTRVPPPAPAPDRPVSIPLPVLASQQKRRWPLALFLAAIALLGGYFYGDFHSQQDLAANLDNLRQRATTAENNLQSCQSHSSQTSDQASKAAVQLREKSQQLDQINTDASDTTQKLSAAQAELAAKTEQLSACESGQKQNTGNNGINVFRMTNNTPRTVHIAVVYRNWAGTRVAEGWHVLSTGQTAIMATSPGSDFGYYVYADNLIWTDKDGEPWDIVRTSDFVSLAGQTSSNPNHISARFRKVPAGVFTINLTP